MFDDDPADPDAEDGPPWIEADDDGEGAVLAIDPGELAAMAERLGRGSAPLPARLTVPLEGGGSIGKHELAELLDEASRTCLEIVSRSPTILDAGAAAELAHHAATIATIWSVAFQTEPNADDLPWLAAIGRLAADCEDMFVTRILPRGDGTFTLKWGLFDRSLLRDAIADLRSVMSSDDPSVSRLFPTAYGDDAERNAGWDVLMRGELIERRLSALETTERIMSQKVCGVDDLNTLMRCINDARLVIGTRLDVDEEGMPADAGGRRDPDRLRYEALSGLLARTVHALGRSL